MEEQFTAHPTLVDELVKYDASNLTSDPHGLPSGGIGGAAPLERDHNTMEITVERCKNCEHVPGPCEECTTRFNNRYERSFAGLKALREGDDRAFEDRNPSQFDNQVIIETPLPDNFQPPDYDPEPIVTVSGGERLQENNVAGYDQVEDLEAEPQFNDSADVMRALASENRALRVKLADALRHLSPPSEQPPSSKSPAPTETQTVIPFEEERSRKAYRVIPVGSNRQHQHYCMWDMELFEGEPIGLPLRYDNVSGTFESTGCFCSMQCAFAYRLEHRSVECVPFDLIYRAYHTLSILGNVIEEQEELIPAGPRQLLKRFGGDFDVGEFRQKYCHHWFQLLRHPFVPALEYVETSVSSLASSSLTAHNNGESSSSFSGGGGLILKRDKPHPNAQNQWQNAIRRSRLR
jgi:hypothetical protein